MIAVTKGGAIRALFDNEIEAQIFHQACIRRGVAGVVRTASTDDIRRFLGEEFDVEIVEDE